MMRLFLVCAASVVLLNVAVPRLITARELSRHPEVSFHQGDGIEYLIVDPHSSFHLTETTPALVDNLRTAMRGEVSMFEVDNEESDDPDVSSDNEDEHLDSVDPAEAVHEEPKELEGPAPPPPQTPEYPLIQTPNAGTTLRQPLNPRANGLRGEMTSLLFPVVEKPLTRMNTTQAKQGVVLPQQILKPVLKPVARPQFDFIVGGFPKCGTTTLLKGFATHNETDMVPQELCSVAAPGLADAAVLSRLDATLKEMPSIKSKTFTGRAPVKRAFKCPTVMYSFKSIIRLEKHSPRAKFVVGIRHPIKFLQSFYNYRVTEMYERDLVGKEPIPSFGKTMEPGVKPWKGVGVHAPRFELFLQQLGKTAMTPAELQELSMYTRIGYELAVKPSNFTIFVYTVDQLEDLDVARSGAFLAGLRNYLGLSLPIDPFGHENKNHQVGDSGHPETISICDPQFAAVRDTLVENGKKTATWLSDRFLASPDVVVANRDHFVETLQSWSVDPCLEELADQEETDSM